MEDLVGIRCNSNGSVAELSSDLMLLSQQQEEKECEEERKEVAEEASLLSLCESADTGWFGLLRDELFSKRRGHATFGNDKSVRGERSVLVRTVHT